MKHDPAETEIDAPENEPNDRRPPAPDSPGAAEAPREDPDDPGTGAAGPPAETPGGGAIKTRRQHMIVYTVGAALAGLLAAWLFAVPLPDYLLYATPLSKADAVVVFGGQDFQARRKMADDLVAKGWAKFVIQPAKGEIIETRVSKAPVTPEKTSRIARAVQMDAGKSFVEQTHVEVLQARKLMAHIDAKRVIFVSSPYQMRRIAIMAQHLFPPGKYEIAYQPTLYVPRHVPWFLAWPDVKWVFTEWGKIGWFILYSPFV